MAEEEPTKVTIDVPVEVKGKERVIRITIVIPPDKDPIIKKDGKEDP